MEIKKDYAAGIIPISVGIDGARSFCLVRHAAGHWAFPKGHIDAGESKENAARRELQEETGILTCGIDDAHTFTERYSFERGGVHYDKEVTYFVGYVDTKQAVAPGGAFKSEISEARWVSYNEAKELLSFPESIAIMDEVCEYLRAKT